jgi:hypothetical protein
MMQLPRLRVSCAMLSPSLLCALTLRPAQHLRGPVSDGEACELDDIVWQHGIEVDGSHRQPRMLRLVPGKCRVVEVVVVVLFPLMDLHLQASTHNAATSIELHPSFHNTIH